MCADGQSKANGGPGDFRRLMARLIELSYKVHSMRLLAALLLILSTGLANIPAQENNQKLSAKEE